MHPWVTLLLTDNALVEGASGGTKEGFALWLRGSPRARLFSPSEVHGTFRSALCDRVVIFRGEYGCLVFHVPSSRRGCSTGRYGDRRRSGGWRERCVGDEYLSTRCQKNSGCFGNVDQTEQTGNPSQRLSVTSAVGEWSTSSGHR